VPEIFADHCVHTDLIKALQNAGFKVVRAQEVSLSKASDEAIFAYAKQNGLVLLSFDKGFGNLKQFAIDKSSGVVIVEVERMSKRLIIERTTGFFKRTTSKALQGGLFIIKPARVRVRLKNKIFELR